MDFEKLEDIRNRIGLNAASKPVLAGLVALAIVVAVVAAGRLIGTATAKEFHVDVPAEDAREQVDGGQAQPETIFVHVSGEVMNPGLCQVPQGARVADAVQAAGGFTERAAAESVNLARTLNDGEQVVVASKEALAAQEAGQVGQGAASAGAGSVQAGLVNINTAGQSDLETLPGIGPSTAAKIVADRQANGAFPSIEDLKRVSGVGDKKFDAIKDLICV